MYTRQGCHLCDDAWRFLEELGQRYTLRLEAVDIDGDPELRRLHGERVPVLVINGRERMWGKISRGWLERQVRAEA
jgi:glutaredoxin